MKILAGCLLLFSFVAAVNGAPAAETNAADDVRQPHTPTLIFYLAGADGPQDVTALHNSVEKLKSAFIREVNTNRSFVRVRFDSHVVSYHQVAQAVADAGTALGKTYQPFTIFTVNEYAQTNNAENVDAIFAGKRLNTRVHVTPLDKAKGKFLVNFLPLKIDAALTTPQGFNGGHLHHPVSDPPPRGLGLTSDYASDDDPLFQPAPAVAAVSSIVAVMKKVADWQLVNPSASADKYAENGWTWGACYAGMMALADVSNDAKYREATLAVGEKFEWKLGPQLYDADDQCVGQAYAELFLHYHDAKMIAPMREQFDSILAKPSAVQNLAYVKPRAQARQNWSWCDALFMAPPAWVRLYAATRDRRYLDFAVTNWWRTTDYLYDKEEHLFYRDSNYFNQREANGQKVFWSRGNGWVMGGLVRVLQFLPDNHPDRPRFEKLFKDMAEKVLTCQQADGLWRASLLDPESYPLKETSGSGFFVYALAWGVNQHLLDRARFEPAIRTGWAALVGCVAADGKLTHVQPIGADPKKFEDSSNDVYGVGAFLLAGTEVYRLTKSDNLKPVTFDSQH